MNEQARWHNVQVYYYDDERRDDLLVDCVRPLFTSLHPRPSFFVRHWVRGPHVRLRFHTTPGDFDQVVRPAVADQMGGWLATHPSTVRLEETALLGIHEWLAARERESGPLSPFHPDNSIQYLPYDRRIEVLGSEAATGMLEDFYVATTELTFAMLEHVRHGTSRLNLALDLMYATARALGSITTGYVAYRSHSEARIMHAADPARLRAFCEQQYRSRADELVERLDQVLGTLDSTLDSAPSSASDDVPFVREWVQEMARLQVRAQSLIADGALTLAVPEPGAWFRDEVLAHSAFHRALGSNPDFLAMMRTSVRFHASRVLLNCCYLQLTRLGIGPIERSLLGFLVAEAVEERFGVSAIDLVSAS